ncbi:MAG: translation initiation factor [Prevotellaceae bacterium]|jgi:translation initiation factor 1|nr:translation initiation factor [Prevotellaceae bacterium]
MDWKDKLQTTFAGALAELPQEEKETPKKKDRLRVELDKRGKGKTATLITGFECSDAELLDIAKTLKSKCGSGGSARDGEVLIQGDFRKKIGEILTEMNYKNVKMF